MVLEVQNLLQQPGGTIKRAAGPEKNSAQERKTTKTNHVSENCSEGSEEKKKREEAAQKQRKAKELKRKEEKLKKKEEELKRKELKSMEAQIKELQARKVQIAGVHSDKGAHQIEGTPGESLRGDGSSKRGSQVKELAKVKQVSGLANSKVTHAAVHPSVSSDASKTTSFADPLLLGVWPVPKEIPPVELNVHLRPTGQF